MENLTTAWSSAGCLLIPRFLFELTGGYDERFFMYCEDVDLCWRVWELGYSCVVAPWALFHHQVAARIHSPKAETWFLESGRMLGAKWGCKRFQLTCERHLVERGYHPTTASLPAIAEDRIHEPHLWVDFGNMFTFARPRW
jgi:GT2 family glycosyltransferase